MSTGSRDGASQPNGATGSPPIFAAVVLAAGQSRRMGNANKLLEPLGGRPMVARVVDAIAGSNVRDVIVVTGHDAPNVRAALADTSVSLAHNHAFASGMSTSVRTGIDAIRSDVTAAIFVLGDMPRVQSAHLDQLLSAFDADADACIVVPVFGEQRGNPVLWSANHFEQMRRLTGDVGARSLLRRHAQHIRLVHMHDAGVLIDVDTPAALDEQRHELAKRH